MSDSNLVGTDGEKLILSPEEAADRVRNKGVPAGGKGGKHAISRAEAVSIATQIGQQVYDQLRSEHALAMGQLQQDLANHFGQIKNVVALNIMDLQQRSFSYRIRRDFQWDCLVIVNWLRYRWEHLKLDFVADWQTILAWLELHGLREPPAREATAKCPICGKEGTHQHTPAEIDAACAQDEADHIGAPTELPDHPEVARTLTLSE